MDAQLLARGLDLDAAAGTVVTRPLQRFPRLITDACLKDAAKTLTESTRSSFRRSPVVVHETLTMPRAGFGPRPVSALSPESRTLYLSLVSHLGESLADATRGAGKWTEHRSFGLDGKHEHIVELDIAAFYEYINHKVLADELLLRSMDTNAVAALEEFLGGLSPRGYGIPQMMQASDRLADTYLSILDRRLARAGLVAHRFADDIRVLAKDWEQANRIVETAAEITRELGLVLSSEKTAIYKRVTLAELEQRDQTYFDDYFKLVHADMVEAAFLAAGPYAEEREGDAGDEDFDDLVFEETALRIVQQYLDAVSGSLTDDVVDRSLRRFVATSLAILRNAGQRLPDEQLEKLVFYDPRRLEQVCRYLGARAKEAQFRREPHWESLARFAALGRQSPWAKLWLLDTAADLPAAPKSSSTAYGSFVAWAQRQLSDPHESVRAEAAWFLAGRELLTADIMGRLYASSTSLSRPALAAAVAVPSRLPAGLVAAIRDESPLSKAAFKWASK